MPLLLTLILVCGLFITQAFGQNANLQSDVRWYDAETYQLTRSAADISLNHEQAKYLFLPAGQWLSTTLDTLNSLSFWQGQTFSALMQVKKQQWICQQNMCQLNASLRPRVIKVINQQQDGQFELWRGFQHAHRDPFRRAVALPLPGKTIALAQEHTTIYPLNKSQSIKVYFKQAKKLKLTVHRNLYDLSQGGKVQALINGIPASIINVSEAQAQEFTHHKLGVANVDYIAVPANSYLTLQSSSSTWVKLEQMHRGIYDQGAGIKQREKLLNPYWVNNLDSALRQVYFDHDISSITQFNPEHASALAIRRHQDFISTISTGSFLTPDSSANKPLTTHRRLVAIYQAPREAKQHLMLSHTTGMLQYNRLVESLKYNIRDEQRVSENAILYVRSNRPTELVVDIKKVRHKIKVLPKQGFVPLNLHIDMNAEEVTVFSASDAKVDIAMQVRTLLPLPNNELLYAQPTPLALKSPSIAALMQRIQADKAKSFLNSLSNFQLQTTPQDPPLLALAQSRGHWMYQLGEVEYLATLSPTKALPKLRTLLDSPFPSVQLRAWQLRLDILTSLNRQNAVLRYLAALLQQDNAALSDFAAKKLLSRYQQTNQIFNIQGLCALKQKLKGCAKLVTSTLLAQGKLLETLWLDHDKRQTNPNDSTLYDRLGYASYGGQLLDIQPRYDITHAQQVQLTAETAEYKAYRLEKQPLTITAHSDINIQISARTYGLKSGEHAIGWLHADKGTNLHFMPIYSDVLSTTYVHTPLEAPLSVASNSVISLHAGETLTLSSKEIAFVQLQIFDSTYFNPYSSQQLSEFALSTPFLELLHTTNTYNSAAFTKLLNNSLYRLEQYSLKDHEFTALFSKLNKLNVPPSLSQLHDRVQSYGHWVPMQKYLNYAGTQLVDLSPIETRSIAEQLSRHTATNAETKGITIRPYHTLSLDFNALSAMQIRLMFYFSDAELISNAATLVAIETANDNTVWPVSNTQTPFGLEQTELRNGIVKIRWLNPYLSQVLQVEVQVLQGTRWQSVELDQRQLFYYATSEQPIIAKLDQDALVKIEQFKDLQRQEEIEFYPAGTIEIPHHYANLARLFAWQLNANRQKLAVAPPVTPLKLTRPTLRFEQLAKHFNTPLISANGNKTHIEGFMSYDRDGIFQTSEPIDTAHRLDFGIRLRNRYRQNWYRLEGAYRLNNLRYESFALNGIYNWLDDDTPWYVEAGMYNRWQEAKLNNESHLTSHIDATIGQIWRDDVSVRHQWWWQPYFYYTSIDKQEYLDDPFISQDMYNFYRAQHMHGWQGGYRIRYQPWVDSQFSAQISTVSNEDWTSLDTATLSGNWQQYYEGHIFSVGLSSSYVFADQHRPNATWQYLTSISWQTLFDFSEETAGWISLNWTQDWFRNNHNVRFEVTLGNLQNTGFAPFAHDEIIFESLQLTHFLEQDINGR
ncbi:hypothetical protein [Pseudoalteromonas luteoviolacea]|uniref:hypothetical protein n=1 Tax=Pseudoalteromonas luteoviolacea TaxID=43657 RepID=UPI001B3723DC|nr:hypothetical protein [Pseudoalteromonas luteoviolacea]MBQ4838875.1 hypothetical protein [Pseudoalteromonas luteoviolacea]